MEEIKYVEACASMLEYHTTQTREIEELQHNIPQWTDPAPITGKFPGISKVIGVYKIIHAPTGEVKSIGQGRVANRKGRHVAVFKNDGKDVVSENGSTSPSKTGQKMYKYDTNIDNWYFSYCSTGNKSIAREYEAKLQYEYEPEFNELSMGGNN